jgi:hypothetical protein
MPSIAYSWYDEHVPKAEALYEEYLRELARERL